MMMDMFSSAKRAFYQSAQTMHIGTIPVKEYYKFAARHCGANAQDLQEEAFDCLYKNLYAHTWYIQSVLNKNN